MPEGIGRGMFSGYSCYGKSQHASLIYEQVIQRPVSYLHFPAEQRESRRIGAYLAFELRGRDQQQTAVSRALPGHGGEHEL
jgi:hypothetical protein